MSGNTFTPGPTPTTVLAADGRVLTAPEGWALVPPGDAALTRRVKEAGDHWVVQKKKGRKLFSRGVRGKSACPGARTNSPAGLAVVGQPAPCATRSLVAPGISDSGRVICSARFTWIGP